jgi:hypothetical protein
MSPSAALRIVEPQVPAAAFLPSPLDLFQCFNQFLNHWAGLPAQFINVRMEDMSPLALEQSLFFTGPLNGLLVLRTSLEFEKYLKEKLMGVQSRRHPAKSDLLLEMTVLFWHRFLMQYWRVDSRTLPPAVLKPSRPVHWPDRKPDSDCVLFIQHFPFEIRFWQVQSEGERRPWLVKA